MGDLAQGDLGALMRLGVRPQANAMGLRIGRHGDEVAFEGIKVEHQSGRVDLAESLAGLGRRMQGHGLSQSPESVVAIGRQLRVWSKTSLRVPAFLAARACLARLESFGNTKPGSACASVVIGPAP
jgi:hypothetical protein